MSTMVSTVRLTEATDRYERHLRARGLSEQSVKNSTQVLVRAGQLWGDLQLTSISANHVDHLFSHYGWAPSTRNLYLSHLNLFLAWARSHKWMPKDASPTEGWRSVRAPKRERMRVPLDDFPSLLDAARHPRDRAIVAIGLFSFLRGSELRTLRISDLDLAENTLQVYRHKTRTADTLPVSAELHAEMVRWLNWYRRDQTGLRPNWLLVPAKSGNYTFRDATTGRIAVDVNRPAPLRPTSMIGKPYEPVQRALAELGYDTFMEGEHTLRRSGARALADTLRDVGYDNALMRVASMLGHSNTRITEHYIGWDLERTRRNADIAGKPMFPSLREHSGTVVDMKARG